MDQLSVIVLSWLVSVNRDASFASNRDHSCKSHSFSLVFPQKNLGKRYQEETEDHGCDSVGVISLVDRLVASRGASRYHYLLRLCLGKLQKLDLISFCLDGNRRSHTGY